MFGCCVSIHDRPAAGEGFAAPFPGEPSASPHPALYLENTFCGTHDHELPSEPSVLSPRLLETILASVVSSKWGTAAPSPWFSSSHLVRSPVRVNSVEARSNDINGRDINACSRNTVLAAQTQQHSSAIRGPSKHQHKHP